MKNLFNNNVYKETIARLDQITPESPPQWGEMKVAQMFNHCQKPLEVILGIDNHNLRPNLLAKLFFKKAMYSDKLWAKGLPTPKTFKVTDEKDFKSEKDSLKSLITELNAQSDREVWPEHPVFGHFTAEQVGKMQYKHLDHHLRQFGV